MNKYFDKTLETIDKISLDSSKSVSLCLSQKKIYNFDKVCKNYTKDKKLSLTPKSCDALWINNELCTFLEFKNGTIDNITLNEIIKKAYDSLFILFDLKLEQDIKQFKNTISYSRENIDFILVYNFEQNGKRYIHDTLNKKAKNNIKILQNMEGFIFHKVELMTETQFLKNIEPLI